MVLVEMGQHQRINAFPPPAEQVAASQLPGVIRAVDAAAVDQNRAVPGHGSDAKPLAHIQYGDGLPPLGIIPGSTAQKQAKAQHSGQTRHAEAQPVFLAEQAAENEQPVAGCQPGPQPPGLRIHHCPRQGGDHPCRKEDIPGKPRAEPGQALTQQRQQRCQTGDPPAHKAEGYRPQRGDVAHDGQHRDIAKIQRRQRRRKHQHAQSSGKISDQIAQQKPALHRLPPCSKPAIDPPGETEYPRHGSKRKL